MARTTAQRGLMLITAATLFAVAGVASAQEVERYSIAGTSISLYNLAGTVHIERGTGDNVIVEVRRSGSDADQLQIDRRTVDGRAALIVRYPDGDVVYRSDEHSSRTTVRVRNDGTFYGDRDGGDRVSIKRSGRGTEAHADLRVLVPAGRSIDVMLGAGAVVASNVEADLSIDVGEAPVETGATRGRLHIDTGSGAVSVRDAQGDVLIDTGSGGVTLTHVVGNRVNVDTGSGRVRAVNVRADEIIVDTGSGAVEMTGIASRDVEINTGSGRVDLDLLTDVDRLVIDTGSGSVTVAVPDDFGGQFDIDGGRVSIEIPAELRNSGRDHARGTFGDGHGTIEIDTGSGRISIVRR